MEKEALMEMVTEGCGMLELAGAFKPLVAAGIDALKDYGPELADIPEALIKWQAEQKVVQYKILIDGGIPADLAKDLMLRDGGAAQLSAGLAELAQKVVSELKEA